MVRTGLRKEEEVLAVQVMSLAVVVVVILVPMLAEEAEVLVCIQQPQSTV